MWDALVVACLLLTAGAILYAGHWIITKLDEARRDVGEAFAAMLSERDFRAKSEAELMVLRAEYQRLQGDLEKLVKRLEAPAPQPKKRQPTSKLRVVAKNGEVGDDPADPPAT